MGLYCPAVTISCPSEEKDMEQTSSSCPSNVGSISSPLFAFHKQTCLSPAPDAKTSPRGEYGTDVTRLLSPIRGCQTGRPLLRSHTIRLLSHEPETNRFASGEKAMQLTASVCFLNTTKLPMMGSKTLTVLSLEPEAISEPIGA